MQFKIIYFEKLFENMLVSCKAEIIIIIKQQSLNLIFEKKFNEYFNLTI